MKQILLVDAQPTFRAGLRSLLRAELDLRIYGEADGPDEALEHLKRGRPDLVITGLEFPEDTGFGFLRQLRTQFSDLPVLVLSSRSDHLHARWALSEGVRGFVHRQSSTAEVVEAVRQVLDGRMHLDERIRGRIIGAFLKNGRPDAEDSPLERLSDRESEVFELLARGRSTVQIAETLDLTSSTVHTYLAKLKEKLRCDNQKDLVREAVLWAEGST